MYKTLVYVSGAMTPTVECPNYEDNINRLLEKSRELFMQGYGVYCPYERWFNEDQAIMDALKADPYGEMYKRVIALDICILSRCDAIYMLKGWKSSRGANIEHAYAETQGIIIWYEAGG